MAQITMPHIERKKNGWLVTVKYKGARYRKQLRTRSMADEWGRKKLDKLKLGNFGDADEGMLLSAAIDRYIQDIAPLQSATGRTRRLANAETIKGLIGHFRLSQLTSQILQDHYVAERLRKVSASTVRRELSLLSQSIQYSLEEGTPNPVNTLRKRLFSQRKPAPPNKRDRRASKQELFRLMKVSPVPFRYVIWLAIQTGMRRGELSKLSVQMLQPKALMLKDTKSGQRRLVPLSQSALKTIERLKKLAHTRNKEEVLIPYSPRTMSIYFKEACDRAKIHDYHFHDLRGEAAHRMLEGRIFKKDKLPYRCSLDEVAKILGNSVRVLESHYANHYRFEDIA